MVTMVEALSKPKPAAFIKDVVTTGNALGINDGAATVVLVESGEELKSPSCSPPIVKVISWGQAGVYPAVIGIPAVRKVR